VIPDDHYSGQATRQERSRLALGTMNFGAAYLAAFDVDWRQEDKEVIDRLVARCSTAAAL
jgi:hypothetical protein